MVSRDSCKPGVYIEFVRQGRVVKVTAIDERTGVEASIIGFIPSRQVVLASVRRSQSPSLRKCETRIRENC